MPPPVMLPPVTGMCCVAAPGKKISPLKEAVIFCDYCSILVRPEKLYVPFSVTSGVSIVISL